MESFSDDMTHQDRLNYLLERYQDNTELLDNEFEMIVLPRIPYLRRNLSYETPEKMKMIHRYGMELEREFDDYLFEIENSIDLLLPDSLSLLHGKLQFVAPQLVASFLDDDDGLSRLLNVIEQYTEAENAWEIYHGALECFSAVIDTGDVTCVQYMLDSDPSLFFLASNFDHPEQVVRWKVVEMFLGLFFMSDQFADDPEKSLFWFRRLLESILQFAEEAHDEHSVWWVLVEELNRELALPEPISVESTNHCGNVVYLINQILTNPNLHIMERFEAHENLRYLGFTDCVTEILSRTEAEELKDEEDFQEKAEELRNQFEEYEFLEENDQMDMPDMEECFSYIHDCVADRDSQESFSLILQCLSTIASDKDADDLWSSVALTVEKMILHGSEMVDVRDENIALEEFQRAKDEEIEKLREEHEERLNALKKKVVELKNDRVKFEEKINKELNQKFTAERVQFEEKIKSELTSKFTAESQKLRQDLQELQNRQAMEPTQNKEIKSKMADLQQRGSATSASAEVSEKSSVPIDPSLEKYAKMLKMKIPKQAVINKMRQDGVEDSRMSEIEAYISGKSGPSQKVDLSKTSKASPQKSISLAPELTKYAKMLKMNIPKQAVQNKMTQDGIASDRMAEIEAYNSGKPVASGPAKEAPAVTVSIAPELNKYAKMLKMNIPKQAVQNKMTQDGIDCDRMKEIEAYISGKTVASVHAKEAPVVTVSIAPELNKYAKMLKMNIPKQAVQNKMTQDGIDSDRMKEIDAYLSGKPIATSAPSKVAPEPKVTLAPELKKYEKMLKMNIPKHAVINKMTQDGVDSGRIAEIEAHMSGKPIPSTPPKEKAEPPTEISLAPELKKYEKMLKMNIPKHAVINKMKQDGVNGDRMKEIEAFMSGKPIPASETSRQYGAMKSIAPELKKYVRMLKMNIPTQAVQNKMRQDGVGDRMKEVEFFVFGKKEESPGAKKKGNKKHTSQSSTEPIKKGWDPSLEPYVVMLLTGVKKILIKKNMKNDGFNPKRIQDCIDYIETKPVLKKKYEESNADQTWKNSEFFHTVKKLDTQILKNEQDLKVFTEKPKKAAKEKKKAKKKKKANKPKKICFIDDMKLLQNMTFMCASLKRQKVSNANIVQAFWSLVADNIDVQSFLEILPPDEVMQVLREKKDVDLETLDAPSRLYYDLRNIPKIKQRADLWWFMDSFDVEEADLNMQIDLMQGAIDGIHQSEELKVLFAAILKLLQTTNKFKYYYGFPLEAVYTVSKKQCIDGSSWMMKLCSLAEERKPGILKFIENLKGGIQDAKKYRDIQGIDRNVKKLGFGIKKIERALATYKVCEEKDLPDGCADRFKEQMEPFLKRGTEDVNSLEQKIKKLDDSCKSLARDFGLAEVTDKKQTNTDYLPQIMNVVKYIEEAIMRNEKIKEAKKKEQRKANEKARREALKKKKAQKKKKKTQELDLESGLNTLSRTETRAALHTLAKKQMNATMQRAKTARHQMNNISFDDSVAGTVLPNLPSLHHINSYKSRKVKIVTQRNFFRSERYTESLGAFNPEPIHYV